MTAHSFPTCFTILVKMADGFSRDYSVLKSLSVDVEMLVSSQESI